MRGKRTLLVLNNADSLKENADLIGALNGLGAGHARLACEVNGEVVPPATGTLQTVFANSEKIA